MWPAIAGAMAQNAFDPVKSFGEYQFARWQSNHQNWENRKAMDDQNAWTAEMANTAHQREVKDLQAAGLNPILASGGKGAPAPSSASPGPMSAPGITFPGIMGVGDLLMQSERLDLDRARTQVDMAKTAEETKTSRASRHLKEADTILKSKGLIRADVEARAAGAINDGISWFTRSKKYQYQPPGGGKTMKDLNDRQADYLMKGLNKWLNPKK